MIDTNAEVQVPPRPMTAAKFWAKVQVSADDDGCWIWTAGCNTRGRGLAHVDGRDRPAHKVAWIWEYGVLLPGVYLNPRCRNGLCVRPDHHVPGPRNARADGTKRCGRCHLVLPLSNFGALRRRDRDSWQSYCADCARADRKKRTDDPMHAERARAHWAAWNAAHPEPRHLTARYGITPAEYSALLLAQNGLCALCGRPESRRKRDGTPRRLAVDHCHSQGHVRALLCFECNVGLGKFQDNPALLRAAADYIEASRNIRIS